MNPIRHQSLALLLLLVGALGIFPSWSYAQLEQLHQQNQGGGFREWVQPPISSMRHDGGTDPGRNPLAPPANDNCAAATTLTVNAGCITGTTFDATTQVGEFLCINPGGGITPQTAWYRFTATSTSMVLGVVLTNTTNCATVLAAYGPFAPGGGCLPGSGNQILCQNMGLIDPGFHPNLTGLVVGQDYLVQVQGNSCGGGSDRHAEFCISINTTSANSSASTASVINSCGVAFNGTTGGGHFPNGTSTGFNNLDNNAATSVTGASEVGDDVTFVINNVSWFSFCNGNASSCNWSMNLGGISGCLLSALNAGVQAAVFTGTPAALTNVASSPSRVAPGGSWASGTFSLAAGACAYIAVDGFAGDECNYTLTLTNVSCPCLVLPIIMDYMTGVDRNGIVTLEWKMSAEDKLHHYVMERSLDGQNFEFLAEVEPKAVSPDGNDYAIVDHHPARGWNHYRLTAIDLDGQATVLGTTAVMSSPGGDGILATRQDDNSIEVMYRSSGASPVELSLSDMAGRKMRQVQVGVQAGTHALNLPVDGLSPGIYVVSATQNGIRTTRKVRID